MKVKTEEEVSLIRTKMIQKDIRRKELEIVTKVTESGDQESHTLKTRARTDHITTSMTKTIDHQRKRVAIA